MKEDITKSQKSEETADSVLNAFEAEVLSDGELENTEGGGNIPCTSNGNCRGCHATADDFEQQADGLK